MAEGMSGVRLQDGDLVKVGNRSEIWKILPRHEDFLAALLGDHNNTYRELGGLVIQQVSPKTLFPKLRHVSRTRVKRFDARVSDF